MLQLPQTLARYFLVTACSLSPANKAAIQQVMRPFILSTGVIYGAEDLDALLHQYPAIYRKHHRLWLHGVEQLTQYLQRAHYIRAETTYERIIHEPKSYVAHSAEHAINQQLATQHSCLIVGDPGIGKSATAGQIALRHLLDTPLAELILGKYTAMALTSAACVPLSHIFIRNHLGEAFGWEAAGYWEAMWRLSAAYLMLVTTTLGVYYLPRLSEIKESSELKEEIIQGYKIILPVAVVCGLVIYLLRDFIIGLLFTVDFIPMRDLFAWQMVGDTLKIGSWILAYLMLGKAMMKLFISTEIIFAISFVVLTQSFTTYIGLEGVSIAYAVNYMMYWIVIAIL